MTREGPKCRFLSSPTLLLSSPILDRVKDRPRSGIQGLGGGRYLERRGTTRSWCLCVGAGLGARPSFLFSCGVSPPHDEGKRIVGFRPHTTRSFCFGKRTQNQWRPGVAPQRGCLCPGPCGVGCGTRCAQTVLAPKMEGTGPGHSPARRRQDNGKGQRQRTTTLDPRMRKDDREKRKDDRLFLSSPPPFLSSPTPLPVIPDPRLKMSRTGPDRGSRVFAFR